MATVYDVARVAQVSIATVSRVFNGSDSVADGTREKVKHAAKQLNYTPNVVARSLMIKRTDTIGIILPDMHGEFFSELVRGADTAAREQGFHLLISSSHDAPDGMRAAFAAMRGKVDGIIMMSPLLKPESLRDEFPEDTPLVFLNSGVDKNDFVSVSIDNRGGAFEMTKHLIDEGHKNIAIISGPKNNLDAKLRLQGYKDALKRNGEGRQPIVFPGAFSEESGYAAGNFMLAENQLPDAVFALNDAMAVGCLAAFNEARVSVPGQVALSGFDDIPLGRYLRPTLTTMHVPIAELGIESIRLLGKQLKGQKLQQSHQFMPSLVVRESTGQQS